MTSGRREDGPGNPSPKREDKHVLIQGSFERLTNAIDTLENLVVKVKGQAPSIKEKSDKTEGSSLSTILSEGNIIIGNKTERIEKLTAELRELLF